jgi:hypothetical protein
LEVPATHREQKAGGDINEWMSAWLESKNKIKEERQREASDNGHDTENSVSGYMFFGRPLRLNRLRKIRENDSALTTVGFHRAKNPRPLSDKPRRAGHAAEQTQLEGQQITCSASWTEHVNSQRFLQAKSLVSLFQSLSPSVR